MNIKRGHRVISSRRLAPRWFTKWLATSPSPQGRQLLQVHCMQKSWGSPYDVFERGIIGWRVIVMRKWMRRWIMQKLFGSIVFDNYFCVEFSAGSQQEDCIEGWKSSRASVGKWECSCNAIIIDYIDGALPRRYFMNSYFKIHILIFSHSYNFHILIIIFLTYIVIFFNRNFIFFIRRISCITNLLVSKWQREEYNAKYPEMT